MPDQFTEIVTLIKRSQYNAQKNVNIEMINLYWQVGEYIHQKVASGSWGKGMIKELGNYIAKKHPELKGFNRVGLYRMLQFYRFYLSHTENKSIKSAENQQKIVPSPMAQFTDIRNTMIVQLSWTHHLTLMTKTQSREECDFYLRLCVRESYTVRDLKRQIRSSLYERVQFGQQEIQASYQVRIKDGSLFYRDIYVFEFLGLGEQYDEKSLQQALLQKRKDFILELGGQAIFIDREYRVTVGRKDFYIDLLFFHRDLQCFVAFELKVGEFRPEYVVKLNFYLTALDRNVKRMHENNSIGIILCRKKNKVLSDYAFKRCPSPIVVAEYQTFLPDKKLLQQKLHELFENEME
jgi:predicted nuclease of restriction endonuclease-like (RecB) superfamily